MSEDMTTDEMEDVDSEEEEDIDSSGMEYSSPEKRSRHAITGRGVTLMMLMADGIIQHGEGVLSLEYLGQKFTADLLPSGKIKSNETGQMFASPSSWAIFCKKLVNPAKKSGCGWASVKYKGRKLDSWKSSWLRQMNLPRRPSITSGHQSPASSVSSDTPTLENSEPPVKPPLDIALDVPVKLPPEVALEATPLIKTPPPMAAQTPPPVENKTPPPVVSQTPPPVVEAPSIEPIIEDYNTVLDLTKKPKPDVSPPVAEELRSPPPDVCYVEEQEEALNLSMKNPPTAPKAPKPPPTPKPEVVKQEVTPEQTSDSGKKDRKPVKHAALSERSQNLDPNVLVESETFSNLNKIQPYTVSMSTNSLLIMDIHCHLTTSEVVGYLGGKWDQSTQHLSIQQAFPCRCRLGDSQNAPFVEEEIRANMKHMGMSLVGWYHSHPYCLPEPSIRDMECQMAYQLRMKGAKSTYFPCVGIINSPYYGKSLRTESSIQMYMVMPPPEHIQSDFGIPMSLKYSVKQNHTVSEDLLNEMKKLTDFYRGSPDWITFQHSWHPGITYLEKLKTSLNNKLPEDKLDSGTFLDFVNHVLTTNS